MTDHELIQIAKKASEFAYAPYSNFYVGAALLTEDEKVFTGCNVENASFGATNCAERTAIFKAVSEGYRSFQKIAIATGNDSVAYPCGVCLQVMQEFVPDGIVILSNNDMIETYTVKELLPKGFVL